MRHRRPRGPLTTIHRLAARLDRADCPLAVLASLTADEAREVSRAVGAVAACTPPDARYVLRHGKTRRYRGVGGAQVLTLDDAVLYTTRDRALLAQRRVGMTWKLHPVAT